MRNKLKMIIAWLIVFLFIGTQPFSAPNGNESMLRGEPVLTDLFNGNWTAEWLLENPNNFTLQNVELIDGKAALIKNNIDIKENGINGFQNGTYDSVRLYGTFGLGLDLSKNYYTLIADTNNNRVVQVDYTKWVWQYGSNSSSGYGQNLLDKPSFAIHLENNVTLITDSNSNRVLAVGPNGEFIWQYGSNTSSGIGNDRLNRPSSAIPSNKDHFLIADSSNNYVVEVNLNKKWVWQYGYPTDNPFDWDNPEDSDLLNPTYSEQLANGTILIADKGNHRVLVVDRGKHNIWQYGKTGKPGWNFNMLNGPQFATRLSNHNTLIADTNNHRVIEVNTTGNIVWQYGKAGTSGSGSNRLTNPTCAIRLPNEHTLITDAGNHRVIEVNTTGELIWQYGNSGISGHGVNYLNTPYSAIPYKKDALVGYFLSQVLDGGDVTNWTTINWDPLLPDDTYMVLFTRTGNSQVITQSGWSDWSDEYEDYSGEEISSPRNRYIQYAALLVSFNLNISPTLRKVEVNGQRYERNGELISELFKPNRLIQWNNLRWTGVLKGGTLKPYYSTGDGTSWRILSPDGDLSDVSTETGEIKFKFLLSTMNTSISPSLENFKLEYQCLGSLNEINIIPDTVEIMVGEKFEFNAKGTDPYGRELEIKPSWSTSLGTMELNVLHANTKAGYGYVNATQGNVSGSAWVTLKPGALEYIIVKPSMIEIIAGEEYNFEAFGYDKYGNEISIRPEWKTDVGTIKEGVFKAQNFAGKGTVVAKVDDIKGIANVTVILNTSIHHPPEILARVPDQIRTEDSEPWILNLKTYEWDEEDSGGDLLWYLSEINESICDVTGAYSNEDVLTFIPKQNAFGNSKATLWLVDSDNMTTSQTLWINITPVNDKPIIDNVPDISIHYNEPYTFDYSNYISDIESPDEDLILTIQEPQGQKYTKVTGLNVTYNYPKSMLGKKVTITLKVSDGEAYENEMLDVSITDNHAPVLKMPFPNLIMSEGETRNYIFDLDDYFSDPDGDALNYFFTSQYILINLHNNNSVTIISPSVWSGSETITFRAMDSFGAMAEGYLKIIIHAVNDPPAISPIPDIYVHYDYDYEFDLSRYVNDPDNKTQDLKIWTTDTEHVVFQDSDNMHMLLNFPEELLDQIIWVQLFVSDGIATADRDFWIHVTDNFPPVLKKEIPDIYFNEDAELKNAFTLSDYFSDKDDLLITYSFELFDKENITIVINENNTVDFSSNKDWFGSSYAIFRAEDESDAFIESEIEIQVIPVNDPPKIAQIPAQKGTVGERWIVDLSPYLSDVDNDVSKLEVFIDPKYGELATVTGKQLTFHVYRPINNEIEIIVSDGYSNSTGRIGLSVEEAEIENIVQWMWVLIAIIVLIVILATVIVIRKRHGRFKVSDVFVIHRNGILIKYVGNTLKQGSDEDIISGMLTAVQSFITDSFAAGSAKKKDEWKLNQLRLGGHEIMFEQGKSVLVTVIYEGSPGERLPKLIAHTVERIEEKYGKILDKWNGRFDLLKGIEDLVIPLLTIKLKPEEDQDDKSSNNQDIQGVSLHNSPNRSSTQQTPSYSSSTSLISSHSQPKPMLQQLPLLPPHQKSQEILQKTPTQGQNNPVKKLPMRLPKKPNNEAPEQIKVHLPGQTPTLIPKQVPGKVPGQLPGQTQE